jgi:hypothetical protein
LKCHGIVRSFHSIDDVYLYQHADAYHDLEELRMRISQRDNNKNKNTHQSAEQRKLDHDEALGDDQAKVEPVTAYQKRQEETYSNEHLEIGQRLANAKRAK